MKRANVAWVRIPFPVTSRLRVMRLVVRIRGCHRMRQYRRCPMIRQRRHHLGRPMMFEGT